METDTDKEEHGKSKTLLQGLLCGCADVKLPAANEQNYSKSVQVCLASA